MEALQEASDTFKRKQETSKAEFCKSDATPEGSEFQGLHPEMWLRMRKKKKSCAGQSTVHGFGQHCMRIEQFNEPF